MQNFTPSFSYSGTAVNDAEARAEARACGLRTTPGHESLLKIRAFARALEVQKCEAATLEVVLN